MRIWAGAESPYEAPFRVLQSGDFYSEKAHIRGLLELMGATDGLVVYDSNGNEKVQIVPFEVPEPISEKRTGSGSTVSRNYTPLPSDGGAFHLTPSPIQISLGQLTEGAIIKGDPSPDQPATGSMLHVTVKASNNAINLSTSPLPEKLKYRVSLMTSNGNEVGVYEGGWTAGSLGATSLDLNVPLGSFTIPTTASYSMYVTLWVVDINMNSSVSNSFATITENTSISSTADVYLTHATPNGFRLGTNGLFMSFGNDKLFSVRSSGTEIKYGQNRFKVDNNGVYTYNGSAYVPLAKKTRSVTSNTTVAADDGVLILSNSTNITLTLTNDSSPEFKVVSTTGTGYTLDGKTVVDCSGGSQHAWSDKKPRIFVSDGKSTPKWYEFYCCN